MILAGLAGQFWVHGSGWVRTRSRGMQTWWPVADKVPGRQIRTMYGLEQRYWTVPAFFKVTVGEDMLHGGIRSCKIFWNMVLQNVHLHSLLGTLWSLIAR